MTISQWLEIRSLSSSILTLTSPPPSPGTVTSVSPTDACSRPSAQPPQPVCPAHRLRTLDRGPTPRGLILPHLSTQELIHLTPQGLTPPPLQVECLSFWPHQRNTSSLFSFLVWYNNMYLKWNSFYLWMESLFLLCHCRPMFRSIVLFRIQLP